MATSEPETSQTQSRPIEVVDWKPFAYWRFKSADTDCQICKTHYEEPCLECTTGHSKGDLTCAVSRGKCGHCFHKHCIDKWMQKNTICPVCKLPYNVEVKDMDNNNDWKRLISKGK